jgi:hypothetical protein
VSIPVIPAPVGRRAVARLALAVALAGSCAGCPAAWHLNRTVMTYDALATETICRELLVNIARAHHDDPLHFTALSNIAATFNHQWTAGATPPLGGTEGGWRLSPVFGGLVSDNPTFSIVPIEGEEFTRRLLTPFPESTLTMLLRQGADVDLVLRLMAAEFRSARGNEYFTFHNRPSDREGYTTFRRLVLHLSSVQDRGALFAEPLIFEEDWTVPAASVSPEALKSLAKEVTVTPLASGRSYRIVKRTIGRIIVTNYNPATLSNAERRRLHEEAQQNLEDELVVDVREGHPGGEYPMHGKFRLRSFANVVSFVGHDIAEEPEYDVAPDPRTPVVNENPAHTLGITASKVAVGERAIRYRGTYYAVTPQAGYQWNKKAFSLLYQLLQMTVTQPTSGPSITIAK